mgnify:FL=1
MSKLNYNRPKKVAPQNQLHGHGMPSLKHGGSAIGPFSKAATHSVSNKWIICEYCKCKVKQHNADRHYAHCSQAAKFSRHLRQSLMGKERCPICDKGTGSMKNHILDKHGFDLTPDGSIIIRVRDR